MKISGWWIIIIGILVIAILILLGHHEKTVNANRLHFQADSIRKVIRNFETEIHHHDSTIVTINRETIHEKTIIRNLPDTVLFGWIRAKLAEFDSLGVPQVTLHNDRSARLQ